MDSVFVLCQQFPFIVSVKWFCCAVAVYLKNVYELYFCGCYNHVF